MARRKAKGAAFTLLTPSLWGELIAVPITAKALEILEAWRARDHNPCIKTYGAGPDGATCRQCFYAVRAPSPKRPDTLIWTCDKRRHARGKPAPDHRAWWPACGAFLPVRW